MENVYDLEQKDGPPTTASKGPSHKQIVKSWTPAVEGIINDILRKSQKYRKAHMEDAISAARIHTALLFTVIAVTPISGTLSIFSFIDTPNANYYNLLATGLSFVSGIFASIVKFGKYNESATDHKNASAHYISLANNAKRQLSLDVRDRVKAKEYVNWITTAYDELFESSPLLNSVAQMNSIETDEPPARLSAQEQAKAEILSQLQAQSDVEIDMGKFPLHEELVVNSSGKYSDGMMEYQLRRLKDG